MLIAVLFRWHQAVLMCRRNLLLKQRRLSEQAKALVLPILCFMLMYLLYHSFPDLVGAVKKVQETIHIFDDEDGAADDDDFKNDDISGHYITVWAYVVDWYDNSYLEQVGVPIAFLQLQWTLITTLVNDRKSGCKDSMAVMSLVEGSYWAGHFAAEALVATILCLVLCFASESWNLFHEASSMHIFLCLETFSLSTISFLSCMSCFFDSPETSGQVACTSAVLSILVFMGAGMKNISLPLQALGCVVPSFGLQYGVLSFFQLTDTHVQKVGSYADEPDRAMRHEPEPGTRHFDLESCHDACAGYSYFALQFDGRQCFCDDDLDHATMYGPKACGFDGGEYCNFIYNGFYESPSTIPLWMVSAVLIADTCIYGLVTWRLSRWRGFVSEEMAYLRVPVALTDAWYYWRKRCMRGFGKGENSVEEVKALIVRDEPIFGGVDHSLLEEGDFQQDASRGSISVNIESLCKSFGSFKALRGVSLGLRSDEITVLLGHNGAGKTTLISILMGLLHADSGEGTILGKSIHTDMDAIRSNVGLCPQFDDMLLPVFTAREMLSFFAALKGSAMAGKDACCACGGGILEAVSTMLDELGLTEKADVPIATLSGGQRRRVSIGVALIGGSEFIVLDEPTSAMDPLGRVKVWELLKRHRKGRTILITTHQMDEAEALADRCAIMASGVVHCFGSPQFLKRKIGAGYTVQCAPSATCTPANMQSLVAFATEAVPGTTSSTLGRSGLQLCLPFEESRRFPAFFSTLDRRLADEFHCCSYDVALPSLESVFLKVTERALGLDEGALSSLSSTATAATANFAASDAVKAGLSSTAVRQLWAVFALRLTLARNDIISTVGMHVPSIIAYVSGCIVLGKKHSLGSEARSGIVAALCLATLFVPGMIASRLVGERCRKLRHLLSLSGCGVVPFWLGNALADVVLGLISNMALFAAAHYFGLTRWTSSPAFYVAAVLFTMQQAGFSYAISLSFNDAATASLFSPSYVLIILILPALVVLGLVRLTRWAPSEAHLGGILVYCSAATSPNLAFWTSLVGLLGSISVSPPASALPATIIALAWCIAFLAYVTRRDLYLVRRVDPTVSTGGANRSRAPHDADLETERIDAQNAASNRPSDVLIALVELRKEYGLTGCLRRAARPVLQRLFSSASHSMLATDMVALERLDLTVRRGECFCLLGPNGAGKSTTLGLLTREHLPTYGNCIIRSCSVLTDCSSAFQHLGVVPQDETLWPLLSCWDHLVLFSRLRGVPEARLSEICMAMLDLMGLTDRMHTRAAALSGGMKRRLSTGIALIGSPEVLLLDEPSAGLDPVSRRNLWNVLLATMPGRSAILTTHSMEEAETLCQRCGILVAGSLKCIGTPHAVKMKFGRGVIISVRLRRSVDNRGMEAVDRIVGKIIAGCSNASLLSREDSLFSLLVPKTKSPSGVATIQPLGPIFSLLEQVIDNEPVEFYSVEGSSLQSVFLDIAGSSLTKKEGEFTHGEPTASSHCAGSVAAEGAGRAEAKGSSSSSSSKEHEGGSSFVLI